MATSNGGDDGILQASESKEGYLYKEGDKKQSWEKMYFILREDKIEYFKTQGDKKVEGTINLTEGRGVREKDQCKCDWPSEITEDYCFGLATKPQTWYFHTTAEEGSVGDWKRLIQGTIEKVGTPDPDWEKDQEGKPMSFFARKFASIGAAFAKLFMKVAPVDDKIKDGVTAGADAVKEQAEADPDASMAERASMGVKGVANVAGAAGVGGEDGKIVADVVSAGAGMAEEQAKADPDASAGERLALGVKGVAKVVGATGVGGEDVKLVTNVVAAGADMAKDQAKADPEASAGERLALGVKGVAKVVGATGVGGEDGKLVTDVVVAVADMAKYQAKADPDASAAERLALGVKGGAEVAGVAVGGDIAKATSSVVSAGAEAVAKACKEQNSKDKKSEEEHAEE